MAKGKMNPSALQKARMKKRKKTEPMEYKLLIRFTMEQKKFIEDAAASVGMGRTAYCRDCILKRKIRNKSPAERQFRLVLTQGCNNINQIARHLNTEGLNKDTFAEVQAMLTWFRKLKEAANESQI